MRSVVRAALEIFSTRAPAKPCLANTSIAARRIFSRVAPWPIRRARAGFLLPKVVIAPPAGMLLFDMLEYLPVLLKAARRARIRQIGIIAANRARGRCELEPLALSFDPR